MNYLFMLNDSPYGTEHSSNSLRLYLQPHGKTSSSVRQNVPVNSIHHLVMPV
jgi:sulfur relay (sulfurtransferase) complex TusBCD TusD component (DsrE family)